MAASAAAADRQRQQGTAFFFAWQRNQQLTGVQRARDHAAIKVVGRWRWQIIKEHRILQRVRDDLRERQQRARRKNEKHRFFFVRACESSERRERQSRLIQCSSQHNL